MEALGVPGCRVTAATELDGGLMLAVGRRRGGGRCPGCGRPSRAGHGRYRRRPADLPSLGSVGATGPGGAAAAVRERGLPAPDLCGAGPLLGDPQGPADASPGRGAEPDRVRHQRRGGGAARAAHGPGPSLLDPYVPHLERRMAGGCEDALARFARGPRAGLRRHAPPSAAPCGRAALETGPPETGPPYGAQVAWPGRRPGRDGHGARTAVFQGA